MHHTLLNFFRKIVKNLKIHASNCATCHTATEVGVATTATFATLDTSATSLPLDTAVTHACGSVSCGKLAIGYWPLAIGLIEVSPLATYIYPRSGYQKKLMANS